MLQIILWIASSFIPKFTSSFSFFLLNILQMHLRFLIPISTTQDKSSWFFNLYYYCHHWSQLWWQPSPRHRVRWNRSDVLSNSLLIILLIKKSKQNTHTHICTHQMLIAHYYQTIFPFSCSELIYVFYWIHGFNRTRKIKKKRNKKIENRKKNRNRKKC